MPKQDDSQFQSEKDKLIDILQRENERLQKANDAKDLQIAEYAARFAELAAQAQQLTAQAQTLHAADKPRLIAAQSGTLEAEQATEDAPEAPAAPAPEQRGEAQQQAQKTPQGGGAGEDKPRRGFWARLFGLD